MTPRSIEIPVSASTLASSSSFSDRDVVDSLLRSCGLERRQTDRHRWMLHRCKFNRYDQVTEITLGRTIRGRIPFNHNLNNNNDNVRPPYWTFTNHQEIGRLTRLKKLHLSQYQAQPNALGTLNQASMADLECLIIDQCQFLTGEIIQEVENSIGDGSTTTADVGLVVRTFATLTKLMVTRPMGFGYNDGVSRQAMSQFMSFVIKTMPNLQELHFSFLPYSAATDETDTRGDLLDAVLNAMIDAASSPFCSNLKVFTWNHSGMTDVGFQKLLTQVCPLYPTLQSISVQNNRISSLLGSVLGHRDGTRRRDESDLLCPFSVSLRTLNLQHNPVMKKLHSAKDHQSEVEALKTLLEYRLPFCGSLSAPWEDWDSALEYELRVNRSGGRMLLRQRRRRYNEKDGGRDVKDSDEGDVEQEHDNDSPVAAVPLSLYPQILHRSYAHSSASQGFLPAVNHPNQATGLLYLLRHVVLPQGVPK